MKKTLLILLMLLSSMAIWAYDFEVDGIFYNITSTTDLTVEVTNESGAPTNSNSCYSGDIVIPAKVSFEENEYNVTSIGYNAFQECQSVTSVSLPEGLLRIEFGGFGNCFALPEIEIPSTVNYIGDDAFRGCIVLKSIEFPEGVTNIGNNMFYDCWELRSVVIPSTVTSIGTQVFSCINNEELTVTIKSDNPPTFNDEYFYPALGWKLLVPYGCVDAYKSASCWSSFTSIEEDPNGIKSIIDVDMFKFGVLSNTELIVIANESSPYTGDLLIPTGVHYNGVDYDVVGIFNNTFKNCAELKSVVLPGSITLIGSNAFSGCTALTKIECQGATPATLSASAFDAYNAIVYVPQGSKEAYKSASGWSNFAYIYEPGEGVVATTEDGLAFITLSDSEVAIIANEDTPYNGDVEIPNAITYNDTEYSVVKILGSAFSGNSNVTSVNLPEGITELADSQFSGCTSLKTIELPSSISKIGNDAFKDCAQLNDITIPSGVTSIGSNAFSGCTGLKQIVLPDALKAIGANAFAGTALTSIEIPGGVERIADGFFKDCTTLKTVVLKSGVKVIGHNAFSGCSSLENITIPESVTAIGVGVLNNCTALTSLTIPGAVEYWDKGTADGCSNLKELIFSDSDKPLFCGSFSENIPYEGCPYSPELNMYIYGGDTRKLFNGCPLETIYLGRNIFSWVETGYWDETITGIFGSAETIKKVTIAGNATSVCAEAFRGCTNLIDLTLGDKIKAIEDDAFYGCSGLTSLLLPNGLEKIGPNAFNGCSDLTSLLLPNGLVTIGEGAFASCTNFKKVVIPSTVKTIGGNAFIGCSSITDLTIENGVETIGGGAFYQCNPEYIVIPSSVKGTLYYGTFTSNNCKRLVIEDSNNSLRLEDNAIELYSEIEEIYIGRNITLDAGTTKPISCGSVKSVTISNKVTEICANLFSAFYGLSSVEIPESVTKIGENAFNGCTELRGVLELSENIESIGKNAFFGTNYSLCRISAVTPPAAVSGMFNADELVAIIVPAESQAAYKAAEGWKDYNILVEKEVEVTVSTPGELSKDVIKLKVTPKNVTKLIVHGEINSEDFSQMKTNFTACHSIDLSDADCAIIPESALQDKKVLTSIVLPDNCIEIKDWAFAGCNSLKCGLSLPSGLKTIGYSVFNGTNLSGELVLPAKLETIKSGAFHGNKNLEKIVAETGSKLSALDYGTFSSCTGLKEVDLSAAPMTTLHQETFKDCYSLTKAVLPSSLENLGMTGEAAYGVFQNCTSLETIEFPESLKRIYEYAFYGCNKLDGLKFPDGLREVYYDAFNGCSSLSSLDMNNCTMISNIGSNAFANCSDLKKVDLTGCIALEKIDSYAFNGCSSLITLNLPAGLSTIGAQTFGECKALANMTVPALVPPTTADDAFYHVNNYTCIIVTPTDEDSWFEYLLATPWGSFMDLENRVGIDVTVDNDIIEDEEGNKHQCGHIWFDRDWHKHHGKHDGARSLSKALVPRTLAEEVTTTTDVSGINGHMSDGLSLYVQNGGMVSFLIVPEDGYVVNSVVYGDEDVTDQLVDGVFTTPAVSDYTSLKVTFDADNQTEIEQVKSSSTNDVCVKGGNIVINGDLDNVDIRIYTLGGSLVYKGNDRVISLDCHGMYIVTVNGKAHKVVL